jgi:hypothetical protein
VLNQYFQPDAYQNKTAEHLYLVAEEKAQSVAGEKSDK